MHALPGGGVGHAGRVKLPHGDGIGQHLLLHGLIRLGQIFNVFFANLIGPIRVGGCVGCAAQNGPHHLRHQFGVLGQRLFAGDQPVGDQPNIIGRAQGRHIVPLRAQLIGLIRQVDHADLHLVGGHGLHLGKANRFQLYVGLGQPAGTQQGAQTNIAGPIQPRNANGVPLEIRRGLNILPALEDHAHRILPVPGQHIDHRQPLAAAQQHLLARNQGKIQLPGAHQGGVIVFHAVIQAHIQPFGGKIALFQSHIQRGKLHIRDVPQRQLDGRQRGGGGGGDASGQQGDGQQEQHPGEFFHVNLTQKRLKTIPGASAAGGAPAAAPRRTAAWPAQSG